jgi:hypothetical protein
MTSPRAALAPNLSPALPSPERPLYYVEAGWSHIFAGGSERDVRFVLTVTPHDASVPIRAQVQIFIGGGWNAGTPDEVADVTESIMDNDVFDSIADWLAGRPMAVFSMFAPGQMRLVPPEWGLAS